MILLGSTGSIGTNALEVAKSFNIPIESLCAGRNITLLNQQIAQYKPKNVCIADKNDAHKLISGHYTLFCGSDGRLGMIESSYSSLVLNALVGFAGLKPSFKALQCNKKLALANKESLVNAGWLLQNADITPIDSEHFGLWYLQNNRPIAKLYITASGGAFRDYPLDKISLATPQEALKHPNWQMGHKITIDSASMANKLFEILEARWLFDTQNIDALIEASSSIHALVAFKDGSITAHLSNPDMKLPIAYALNPTLAMNENIIEPFSPQSLSLCLKPIDTLRYPLWNLKNILLDTPQKGVVLNSSNEVAIESFLAQKIPFGEISALILAMMTHFDSFAFHSLCDLESICALDEEVRNKSTQWLQDKGYRFE